MEGRFFPSDGRRILPGEARPAADGCPGPPASVNPYSEVSE